jgi:serine/threonine protein kinase
MALDTINSLNNGHIIKCLAAIRRGDHRYFMFPWANGGSLRDFWKSTPKQDPNADIIRQIVIQLRGLADALYRLHNFEGKSTIQEEDMTIIKIPDVRVQNELVVTDEAQSQSIRHGDLKPENILRFLSEETIEADKTNLGVLKLADMGLAKRHVVATQDRKCLTSTRYGTIQYEAPETVTALENQGRSRLYDVWSMGCITLEFIIWVLYGNRELDHFYKQVKGDTQETQYFEIREGGAGAEVHRVVRRWMDHIQNTDPECTQDSAIRDLLELVRTKLLVVDLPPWRPSLLKGNPGPYLALPSPGEDKKNYRVTAESFLESLDLIISKLDNENYILTGKGRKNVKPPANVSSSFLSTTSAKRRQEAPTMRNEVPQRLAADTTVGRTTRPDYTLPPLKDWEFPVDNAFAKKVLDKLGPEAMQPRLSVSTTLCSRCKNLNFWRGGFAFEDRVLDLEGRSNICDFCRMLWGVCTKVGATRGPIVRFERIESTLRLSGSQSLPVLSIFRSPGKWDPLSQQYALVA